jgi:hypothetical protein
VLNWNGDIKFIDIEFDLFVDFVSFSWKELNGCFSEQVVALLIQLSFCDAKEGKVSEGSRLKERLLNGSCVV